MSNAIYSLLSDLVLNGELTGTGMAYQGNPLNTSATGWDFSDTPTGAPASLGVEELRRKLIDQNREDLAGLLPRFHVCDFWRNDEFNFGFASGANKFSFDNYDEYGLSKPEAQQLVAAINLLDNRYFEFAIYGDQNILKNMYRGEPNGTGFSSTDTIYGNGAWAGAAAIPRPASPHLPGAFPVYGPEGHYVYDVYFKANTDENITRFWTSWARAWGANV